MNQLRRVAAAAYLLAAILILFTVMDLVQSVWPIRVGDVQWRVLSVGLLSRMLITPLLGLVIAYAAALLLEHRRVLRTLAVLEALLALILVVGMGFYALDALELRARITEGNRNYDLGIAFSFVKYALGFAALAVLTVSQWRTASGMRKGSRRQGSESGSSVVFAPGDKGDKGPAPRPAAKKPREAEPVQEA
jgi:hypothetical protein